MVACHTEIYVGLMGLVHVLAPLTRQLFELVHVAALLRNDLAL